MLHYAEKVSKYELAPDHLCWCCGGETAGEQPKKHDIFATAWTPGTWD